MNNLVISIKPYILQLWWLGQLQEEINLNKPLSSRLFWITKGRGMHRNQKYLIKVSTWKEYFFTGLKSILWGFLPQVCVVALSCGSLLFKCHCFHLKSTLALALPAYFPLLFSTDFTNWLILLLCLSISHPKMSPEYDLIYLVHYILHFCHTVDDQ
jgi:hypothetical protein